MKVRCTCGCGQMVSRATHKRHLDGGGPTQVRINAAQRAINYTSRLVDRFKKKHPRERSATPESDAPPRKVARTAASTPASLPGTPMDIDDFGGLHTSFTPAMDRTPQEEPPIAENLDFLPTTRPRVLRTASEDSEGSAGSDPAPDIPNLTFTDPNVPDLDAELDEAALEHCELSAADILSGNILSQDAQSGPRLSERLIPENLVKNLLDLWSGEFKNLDTGKEDYELTEATREAIGRDCALAGDTTPAAFGARVPNLHTQRHYFTAESYTLWTTLLGPVLLHGRFQRPKYYNHFLDLVSIFNDCLALSIDREYVNTTLRQNIIDWVKKYERYYYQHNVSRLRACPLTVHALLHIADNILNAGPMWTYWNYITERFVGYLVRSSKSRKNPYASFARRLREIAQNSAIKVRYRLREELDLSNRREEDTIGHSVASYPGIRVLYPRAEGPLERGALKAARNHLVRTYQLTEAEARDCVPENVVHWGKISFLNGGNKMRASELVQHSEHNLTRDASFIKYSHSVDKNQRFRNRPVDEEWQVSYGQLLRIIEFKVRFPRDIRPRDRSLLLALVRPVRCAAKSDRLGFWYYQDGQFLPMEVIDVDDISCLVARIPGHKPGPQLWALCERQDAMAASDDVE
ncbi:hypothetical protein MKEN_00381900 [Mycena kentingensis (nom. inval.)]|nr:hypothetical protein MKEN_00381900 [Mycena kentingensis (nom. inval.)]